MKLEIEHYKQYGQYGQSYDELKSEIYETNGYN